jgi:hypothetical protein
MAVTSAALGVFNPIETPPRPVSTFSGIQLHYTATAPVVNGIATLYARTPDGDVIALASLPLSQGNGTDTLNFNNVGLFDVGITSGTRFFAIITQDNGPDVQTPDSDPFDTVCFLGGTWIATPYGDIAVEMLRRGDLVLTADGRAVPLLFIGRQHLAAAFADRHAAWPVRIRVGALEEGVPARDLFVSPDHAMLVGGVLCAARALVNGDSIAQVPPPGPVLSYYSLEVAAHEVLLAEGAPAESFMDHVPRTAFHNHADFQALYPEGRTIVELPLPVARAHRQVPQAVRAQIAARAAALGGTGAAVA